MTPLSRSEREKLRQSFRPSRVRLLFIGESPPASGRFFYARDSGLYRAMRDAFRSVDPALGDDNFLTAFQARGCYLTDLCAEPVDRLEACSRRAARRAGERRLAGQIVRWQPAMLAPVVLAIGENVTRAAARAGWQGPILSLPYPGRWHRHREVFIETLAPTLRELAARQVT